MTLTQITPPNVLFKAGGADTVSEPFQITKPTLIIAFGLTATTGITAEFLDMAVSTDVKYDDCCFDPCNPYPDMSELVVQNTQPVCDFKICSASYIGKLLVPGYYRIRMSDSTSLNTAKVWSQTTTMDVALNLPVCPVCPVYPVCP